ARSARRAAHPRGLLLSDARPAAGGPWRAEREASPHARAALGPRTTSKRRDRCLECRKVPFEDAFDLRQVDAVVLVREYVGKSSDLPPQDFGTPRLRLISKGFDCFARSEERRVGKESRSSYAPR